MGKGKVNLCDRCITTLTEEGFTITKTGDRVPEPCDNCGRRGNVSTVEWSIRGKRKKGDS